MNYLKGILVVVASIAIVYTGNWLSNLSNQDQDQKDNNVGYRENTKETTMATVTTVTSTWGTGGEGTNGGKSVVYYRNNDWSINSTGATATIKFACSISDDEPTWTGAQNATNTWDYVQVVDKQNGTSIDGDTGVILDNTTDSRTFAMNDDNSRWCNVLVTSTAANAGTIIVKVKPADNQ